MATKTTKESTSSPATHTNPPAPNPNVVDSQPMPQVTVNVLPKFTDHKPHQPYYMTDSKKGGE